MSAHFFDMEKELIKFINVKKYKYSIIIEKIIYPYTNLYRLISCLINDKRTDLAFISF